MKWFPIGITRIVKESFSPSFASIIVEKNTPDNSKSNIILKNEKSDKKKDNKWRKYININTVIACCECELTGHYHFYCFYLLPQKALKESKSRDELKKAAEQALKKNTSLAKEIKQLQVLMNKDKNKNKRKNKEKKKITFIIINIEDDN